MHSKPGIHVHVRHEVSCVHVWKRVGIMSLDIQTPTCELF